MIPVDIINKERASAYLPGGTDAGAPMVGFYRDATVLFVILPKKDPIIAEDRAAGSWGLAWFFGLSNGLPIFSVRDDVVLNAKIGYHEAGHAFEALFADLLARQLFITFDAAVDVLRTAYWQWRGFPGTWQEALDYSYSLGSPSAGWAFLPGESLAEAFSAAVSGIVLSEWTASYGKDLALSFDNVYTPIAGALRARAFFLSIMKEVAMLTDEEISRIADAVSARILPEVLGKLQAGFNTSVTTFIDRQTAGDKKVATAEIDQ